MLRMQRLPVRISSSWQRPDYYSGSLRQCQNALRGKSPKTTLDPVTDYSLTNRLGDDEAVTRIGLFCCLVNVCV